MTITSDTTESLYEILVPCNHNDGRPIRTRYHRVWDKKVRDITGGLTVMPPITSGQWVSDDHQIFSERMIPVRILAKQDQMKEIAKMTAKYYSQLAVMYYTISSCVTIYSP